MNSWRSCVIKYVGCSVDLKREADKSVARLKPTVAGPRFIAINADLMADKGMMDQKLISHLLHG